MNNLKSRSHNDTEQKYKKLREIAYKIAIEEFPEVKISGIDYRDAMNADRWKSLDIANGRKDRAGWD